jgi:hypothetical protein
VSGVGNLDHSLTWLDEDHDASHKLVAFSVIGHYLVDCGKHFGKRSSLSAHQPVGGYRPRRERGRSEAVSDGIKEGEMDSLGIGCIIDHISGNVVRGL